MASELIGGIALEMAGGTPTLHSYGPRPLYYTVRVTPSGSVISMNWGADLETLIDQYDRQGFSEFNGEYIVCPASFLNYRDATVVYPASARGKKVGQTNTKWNVRGLGGYTIQYDETAIGAMPIVPSASVGPTTGPTTSTAPPTSTTVPGTPPMTTQPSGGGATTTTPATSPGVSISPFAPGSGVASPGATPAVSVAQAAGAGGISPQPAGGPPVGLIVVGIAAVGIIGYFLLKGRKKG